MAWDQSQFDAAIKKKYELQQQNADTALQDVTQRPEIQARSDAAAMQRAQLASQTQLSTTDMVNQAQADRAAAANVTQTNIADMQDTGATTRAGMQTGTQLQIAGMENQLGRDRLNQQGQQFDQRMGLDAQKAQEDSYLKRLDMAKPLAGSLDLSKPPNVGLESPWGAPAAKPASPLAGMPDALLGVLKGQADRAQVATPPSSPAPAASSDPNNPRNGLFSSTGTNATPTTPTPPPTPPAAPAAPPVNPRANLDMGRPTINQRISAALTPPSDSVGMAALRDVRSGLSSLGNALGFNRNWGQGLRSFVGGETPEQLRARRAAAAASSVGQ